ncbi:hypothetical protein M9H77_03135 [Catharanthus roseus]|uniref:Uncharacterized protein n=1 Tax=Catharanthus roseus TaxID=4058 RepID=A0ACC0CAD0_CATRO|nr:hypothetical protein M9H77_03135 [Catharanthus roseus]
MELKLGPMIRAQMKKLKDSNGNEDNIMVAYIEEALTNKFEARIIQGNNLMVKMAKYRRRETLPLMVLVCFLFLICGFYYVCGSQLPTQSHQEGTSDPTRMNLNETWRSMQQSIKGLARQFHSVARDIEVLKKRKSSAPMEQRVGDNFGRVNSPHRQRPYDNLSTQGYHDMSAHTPYPFHEGRFQGRPQGRSGRSVGQGVR